MGKPGANRAQNHFEGHSLVFARLSCFISNIPIFPRSDDPYLFGRDGGGGANALT